LPQTIKNDRLAYSSRAGRLDIFQEIWNWAKENLTTEEIKNKLLFATNHEKMTAWHLATRRGIIEIFRKYGISLRRN